MYSCNDCNGWDDSTSTISSSPSQIVRCSNNGYNGNFQNSGVHQVNLGNVRFICGQVRKDDGCCCNNQQMARGEDSPCDLDQYNRQPVKESALSRRKRYLQRYRELIFILLNRHCVPQRKKKKPSNLLSI